MTPKTKTTHCRVSQASLGYLGALADVLTDRIESNIGTAGAVAHLITHYKASGLYAAKVESDLKVVQQ